MGFRTRLMLNFWRRYGQAVCVRGLYSCMWSRPYFACPTSSLSYLIRQVLHGLIFVKVFPNITGIRVTHNVRYSVSPRSTVLPHVLNLECIRLRLHRVVPLPSKSWMVWRFLSKTSALDLLYVWGVGGWVMMLCYIGTGPRFKKSSFYGYSPYTN